MNCWGGIDGEENRGEGLALRQAGIEGLGEFAGAVEVESERSVGAEILGHGGNILREA